MRAKTDRRRTGSRASSVCEHEARRRKQSEREPDETDEPPRGGRASGDRLWGAKANGVKTRDARSAHDQGCARVARGREILDRKEPDAVGLANDIALLKTALLGRAPVDNRSDAEAGTARVLESQTKNDARFPFCGRAPREAPPLWNDVEPRRGTPANRKRLVRQRDRYSGLTVECTAAKRAHPRSGSDIFDAKRIVDLALQAFTDRERGFAGAMECPRERELGLCPDRKALPRHAKQIAGLQYRRLNVLDFEERQVAVGGARRGKRAESD